MQKLCLYTRIDSLTHAKTHIYIYIYDVRKLCTHAKDYPHTDRNIHRLMKPLRSVVCAHFVFACALFCARVDEYVWVFMCV